MEDLNSGHNIRATVFLECREMYRADGPPELRSLGETQFVAGVSAMGESGKYGPARACQGIIGNVDFRVGCRAKGILEQHIIISGGRFRGIRNGATWHEDPSLRVFTSGSGEGLYVDRAWREGFAALAPLNLSFEAWMFHTQLGAALTGSAVQPRSLHASGSHPRAADRDRGRMSKQSPPPLSAEHLVLQHSAYYPGSGPAAGSQEERTAPVRTVVRPGAPSVHCLFRICSRDQSPAHTDDRNPATSETLGVCW